MTKRNLRSGLGNKLDSPIHQSEASHYAGRSSKSLYTRHLMPQCYLLRICKTSAVATVTLMNLRIDQWKKSENGTDSFFLSWNTLCEGKHWRLWSSGMWSCVFLDSSVWEEHNLLFRVISIWRYYKQIFSQIYGINAPTNATQCTKLS